MKKLLKAFGTFGISVLLVLVAPQAFAATTEEISSAIIDETLQNLNVNITDQELIDSLTEDLNYALEENLIDEEVIELTEDSIDNDSDLDLDDTQNSIEDDLENDWNESEEALKIAFDQIKFEFQTCREQAVQSARECALGLGFKFQSAITEQLVLQGQELEVSLENLSGEELLQAQNQLAELNRQIENRINRIDSKLIKFDEFKMITPEMTSDISKFNQLKMQATDQIRGSQTNRKSVEDENSLSDSSGQSNESNSSGNKSNDSQKGNSENDNSQNGNNSNRGNGKK